MRNVSIRKASELPAAVKAMARNLEAFLDRRAAKVEDVVDEEIDAAIDEALHPTWHKST